MGSGIVTCYAKSKSYRQIVILLSCLLIPACHKDAKNSHPGAAQSKPQPDRTQAEAHPKGKEPKSAVPLPPPPVTFKLSATGLPDTGMWKCDPVFADVNGDGNLDLALHPRKGESPHVWLGDGKGAWKDSSAHLRMGTTCGGGLAIADVNKDGFADLAVGDHCNGGFVFLGDGHGGWSEVAKNLYPTDIAKELEVDAYTGAEDIDLGDVNGDGNIDMVMGATDKGGISLFFGDGTGTNWKYQKCGLPTAKVTNRVEFVDINGDGKLDLAAAYQDGPRVWLGDGTGLAWKAASDGLPTPFNGGLYRGQAFADINKDGRKDMIVANWIDGPEVYFQNANGSWTKAPDVFPEMTGGAIGLDVGDVDGDGNLDIVVSGRLDRDAVGYVYGLFFLQGDGKGKFRWIENSGLPDNGLSFTWGVKMADVNKDGVLDFAAGSGGIVATDPARSEPVIAPRVLFYLGQKGSKH